MTVSGVEETHPLYDVPYYRPKNLLPNNSPLSVYGLIELQSLRDNFAVRKNGLIVDVNLFKNEKTKWMR